MVIFLAFSFNLLTTISAIDTTSSTSCAYYANEEVAIPLGVCNSFSSDTDQYSYQFVCDAYGGVEINTFSDAECSQADFVASSGEDEVGTSLQCIGSGENCNTIDVTLTELTTAGSCDDASDFQTFHYVIDECISTTVEGIAYSSLLSCDAEKLWLDYYVGCESCDCDGEQYTEIYYDDLPGCFDINCGDQFEYTGIGVTQSTTPSPTSRKRKKCKRLNKESIRELTGIMGNGAGFTESTILTAQKLMFKENVISGSTFTDKM
eukprot:362383_1